MESKLREHMDELFRDVPPTKQSIEIKEEILQNITDKYHDLLAEGKSEEAAYNIAIASIGNLDDLLKSLKQTQSADRQTALMEEYNAWKKKSALRISVAVMLYIMSVIPPILTDEFFDPAGPADAIGAIGLFVMAAIATGILVYNSVSKPAFPASDGSIAKDFKKWQDEKELSKQSKQALHAIEGALWCIIIALYFVISFSSGAWYITWVIFPIGGACNSILRAIFTLKN